MANAPIILVPGFWLGGWAWDEVASALRADGHTVTALTLPGLESASADRSKVRYEDHVAAITDAVRAAGARVVLAAHSGAGGAAYAASNRVPELIAAMVYVDTGPATGAMDPGFEGAEFPLPSWNEIRQDPGNSLEGLSDEQLETFRRRAVPEPGALLREAPVLGNEARLDIPSTVICTAIPSEQIKAAAEQGYAWLGDLSRLRNLTYVDLPTSHWSMWTRPGELAEVIGGVADGLGTG